MRLGGDTIPGLSVPVDRIRTVGVCRAFAPAGTIGGNPAAVVITNQPLPVPDRAELATLVGLPMTAFVHTAGDEQEHHISYFSANGHEFQICGHATAAAARIVASVTGLHRHRFRLARPFPELSTIRTEVAGHVGRVMMTLPTAKVSPGPDSISSRDLARMAGIDACSIEDILSSSVGDLMAIVAGPSALRAIVMDEVEASAWCAEHGLRGLLFTCQSDRRTHDVETRAFFPAHGIAEDVACGSANCAVIPYWHARLGGGRSVFHVAYPSASIAGRIGGEMEVRFDGRGTVIELYGSVTMSDPTDLAEQLGLRARSERRPG